MKKLAKFSSQLKKVFLDDVFWIHIQKGVCIFKTIVEPFESLQSNYSQINVVYIKLNKLENMLSELLPISSLQKKK